jgi:hypothetical protein
MKWKEIDKYLNKHYKNYLVVNQETQDLIEDVLDEYSNIDMSVYLNKTISKARKEKLDRRIKKLLKNNKATSYMAYKLNLILKKKSITYKEMLEALIMSAFFEERTTLDEYENVLIKDISKMSYNYALDEITKEYPKKEIKHYNYEIQYVIMNIPLLYGTMSAYMWALSNQNAEEIYKRILLKNAKITMKDLQETFKKQQNAYLKLDTHSGVIENYAESYANLGYAQAGIENDIEKCRFVAEMDKRTTIMCQTLNNQVFYVNKMNVYDRYSDIDKKNVVYHTMGLKIGENLPPINNHFHWCRSSITYNLDKEIAESVREKVNISNNYDKEQFNRYKKYFGDDITDDVEEFTRMKLNDSDKWEELKSQYYDKRKAYNTSKK